MSEYYVGEIRPFAGNYAPVGWALCDGRLLSIAQYSTLYTLIGTTYGGDGQSTFALPDLRGRSAVHAGTVRDGTYVLGQRGGVEHVTLTPSQLPVHSHAPISAGTATTSSPAQSRWAAQASFAYTDAAPNAQLAPDALSPAGGGQPHDNMPPFVAVTYIIATEGLFPPRE